jgi:arginase
VSRLRARCPDCRTLTAVALGPEYECHSCGRRFGAGLVRVPRAWGDGGEEMAAAARLPLPYPEAATVEEDTLGEQSLALALALPERPLVLGGCCCSHVGTVEGLATRHGRIAVVWIDAHGDLNTPETSPSGNAWGMPLRMLIDSQAVRAEDVALVGARNLDPPEERFIAELGLPLGLEGVGRAIDGADRVYVALDADALDGDELGSFMPEPGGLSVDETESLLADLERTAVVAGLGLTGLTPDPGNVEPLVRLSRAAGLEAVD